MKSKEITKILFLPGMILVLTYIFGKYDLFANISYLDTIMHFIGGISIGVMYVLLLVFLKQEHYLGKTHRIVLILIALSFVALTILLWEFKEFFLDQIQNTHLQESIQDTMFDLLIGLLGGILGIEGTILKRNYARR